MLFSLFCLSLSFIPIKAQSQNTLVAESDPKERSYLVSTLENGEVMNGTFPGWCANANIPIKFGATHSYTFYSSLLSQYPSGLVDKPENLDAVNWLINQKIVGKPSPTGLGNYTFGDQQVAMWTLLNFTFVPGASVNPYNQNRVNEIVSTSLARGNGFIPRCNQIVGIIIDPIDEEGRPAQSLIIEIPRRYFPKCVVPHSGQ